MFFFFFFSSDGYILFQLMEKDWTKRLGFGQNGANDVMGHQFFDGLSWSLLERRELKPPYKPYVVSKICNQLDGLNITYITVLLPRSTVPYTAPLLLTLGSFHLSSDSTLCP